MLKGDFVTEGGILGRDRFVEDGLVRCSGSFLFASGFRLAVGNDRTEGRRGAFLDFFGNLYRIAVVLIRSRNGRAGCVNPLFRRSGLCRIRKFLTHLFLGFVRPFGHRSFGYVVFLQAFFLDRLVANFLAVSEFEKVARNPGRTDLTVPFARNLVALLVVVIFGSRFEIHEIATSFRIGFALELVARLDFFGIDRRSQFEHRSGRDFRFFDSSRAGVVGFFDNGGSGTVIRPGRRFYGRFSFRVRFGGFLLP